MSENPVVIVENVSFSYDGDPVLEDVNLSINEKDFVWVVGPNGGGKTTLLKLMLGLLIPQRGRIRIFNRAPGQGRSRIGYMPQTAHLDPQFPVNALDVALMGRLSGGRKFGPFRAKDRRAAEKALREVGLFEVRNKAFSALSGGQQRRLLVARALAGDPELLILDEPTANLDLVVEKELFALLRKLNEKLTVIVVSHEPAIVSDFVKRVVCVNRKVSEHPTCAVEGEFMADLFTGGLRVVRHDRHLEDEENRG